MSRCLVIVALFICTATTSFAQKISLIHSGEVIKNAKVLYDSGNYSGAIEEFLKVQERDTNYVYMLSELAIVYNANKEYDKALEVCETALQKPSIYRSHILRSQAVATDKKGGFEKSVTLFEKALKEYPTDYTLMYSLGITYYNNKAYEKAVESFFNVLSINPFHSGSHLNLATISIGQGRKAQGMLALGMYLGISSQDNERLILLNNFLDNQVTDEGSLAAFGPNVSDRLDQIIRAKVALDKDFKSAIPINAAVVKQFELLFDQLNVIDPATGNPWTRFYLPVYKAIKDQQTVESFVYHILTSADNAAAKKWRKKNEKSLTAFFTIANTSLKKNREKVSLPLPVFSNPVQGWYDSDNRIEALGDLVDDKRRGPWIFFHNNFETSAEGSYDEKGVKKGTWKYYRNDGSVSSMENYDTGEVTVYSPDGTKREFFFLKDGEIHGDVELYHLCGPIKEKLKYEAGKRQGKGIWYYPGGNVNMTYNYTDNNADGEFVTYYENGQVSNRTHYKEGLLNGSYISYFINGKVKAEGEYLNDNAVGQWKYYYSNGKPEKTGRYADKGFAIGEWLYYDDQGLLIEKRNFDNEGKLQGENTFYSDSKIHYVLTYKNDLLIGSVFYNGEGKETGKNGSNDGNFKTKNYFITGQVLSEGAYKKGKANGLWKYYNRFGKLVSQYSYVDGLNHGKGETYYPSGEKKTESEYKDDELHGYYREFYRNGKVKQEGWFQNGNREQQWLTYSAEGLVESDYYYLLDEITGPAYDYAQDGKVHTVILYDKNGISDIKHFDSKGVSGTMRKTEKSIVSYEDRYPNKKLKSRYDLLCGEYVGSWTKWLPDGTVYYKYDLLAGKKHGRYENNEITGKNLRSGVYSDGEADGVWKRYHDNGRLYSEGRYVNGSRDSVWTFYSDQGKITFIINYKNDLRHGVTRYFSPEGIPLLEKHFEAGDLVSYRSLDENGKSGEWINFSGTGKIEMKYANGNKAWEEEYKDGQLHGYQRQFFLSGKLYDEYHYNGGDFEGPFKVFYSNGNIKEKGVFKDDEMEGKAEFFNEDGSLFKVEHLKMGVRNGKTTFYKNKAVVKEYTFWNGMPEK